MHFYKHRPTQTAILLHQFIEWITTSSQIRDESSYVGELPLKAF